MSPLAVEDLGTIVGVWAHPDDETYLSAGIMAQAIRNGQRVVCVTATKGEAGSQDEERWPTATLAAVREAELMTALGALGVTEHHWLGYPDGGCDGVDDTEAIEKIGSVLRAAAADTVLTFGPDGQTGHPDHIAVCRWTTAAAARVDGTALYYATVTPEWWEGRGKALDAFDVWFAGYPAITPRDELAIDHHLSDEQLTLKFRAIEAQVSQSAGLIAALGKDAFLAGIGEETYRLP